MSSLRSRVYVSPATRCAVARCHSHSLSHLRPSDVTVACECHAAAWWAPLRWTRAQLLKSWALESGGLGFESQLACSLASSFNSEPHSCTAVGPERAGQKTGASGPPDRCLSPGKSVPIWVYISGSGNLAIMSHHS